MKYVHVQAVLTQEDVIALKAKTGESSVKEAISKAIYDFLKYCTFDDGVFNEKKSENKTQQKYVHVQSVLPQEDVIALKAKTGESSVKEAISKAVWLFLTIPAKR